MQRLLQKSLGLHAVVRGRRYSLAMAYRTVSYDCVLPLMAARRYALPNEAMQKSWASRLQDLTSDHKLNKTCNKTSHARLACTTVAALISILF